MRKNPKQMTVGETATGELLDWYAGQALAGLLASGPKNFQTKADIYGLCFRAADGMLAARQIEELASSRENESIKPKHEQDKPHEGQSRPNEGETVGITRNGGDRRSEVVHVDGLLQLTVPHLTYAKEDSAESDKKRILISCGDRWHRHRNPSQDKSNGPLSMIAQILGIHRRKSPFAEIKLRLHLREDGTISQEVVLPRGWIVVD